MKLPLNWRLLAGLAALALALLLYLAWTRLSKPWGEQAVRFTPAAQHCADVGSLHYCVHRPVGQLSGDVVYHLHGRNLEAEVWNDASYLTAMVQGFWQSEGLVAPTVVSLSYGRQWLLTPKGEADRSGLLDSIWPQIEAIEARLGRPRRRLLVGESMGGLNALVLGLSQAEHFDKIAALCPGVYVESPFASFQQLHAAVSRTGAEPLIAAGVWMLARRYVANDAEWDRVSPLRLIERLPAADARPSLYLSCGLYDRYGNFEGSERLAMRARERGLSVEWHPLYGGHCATDIASLARFLVR